MKVPRSDGSILHVDFEAVTDGLVVARNAGVVLDYGSGARILNNFAYRGRRCAHIACSENNETAQIRLVRAWDAPVVVDGAVLEFVFRPVVEEPIDLVHWPIVRCYGRSEGLEEPEPVAVELRANGEAGEGTYGIEVYSDKAIVAGGIEGLPQAEWTRFVLYRKEDQVELYAGPPRKEKRVASYPDLSIDGEIYCVALGNAGDRDARGSGHWDAVRLGRVRSGGVAPAEERVVHVGEQRAVLPEVLALGREKQLFVDDWSVAESRNIRRVFHRPQKHPDNPLIVPEHPWEGEAIYLFGGVERREDGSFRMWYFAADPTPENRKNVHTCLAVSEDGLHWEKPGLGIHEYGGSRENNIAIMESGPYSLIVDADDPRPDFRYKAHLRHGGTTGWTSPDGLDWTCRGVILPQSLDATSVHWDPVRQKYIASVKIGYKGRRYRGYAESDDFLHWTDTWPMMDVDELDDFGDQVYAMKIFRYESLYLGLAKIYHVERDDTCDIHLAVSHNGKRWERPFRPWNPVAFAARERSAGGWADDENAQPFLPTGAAGSWEYGNHDTAGTPPIRVGDELWFYYSGRARSHGGSLPEGVEWGGPAGSIGLATLRMDGFVSAEGDASGGWLLTRPLRLEGKQLYVNADADGGELTVEILDMEGGVLAESHGLVENGVRLPCGWQGLEDLEMLRERAVRLRFRLAGAALYAFWCE
jgi:hypothetical protein